MFHELDCSFLIFFSSLERFLNWKLQTGIGSIKDEIELKSGWTKAPSGTENERQGSSYIREYRVFSDTGVLESLVMNRVVILKF